MGKQHGLSRLRKRIALRGLHAVDRRTTGYRMAQIWRNQIEQDLGGDLSEQKKTLLDIALISKLYLSHLDSFLLQQKSLIIRRTRSAVPVLAQRMQLASQLEKTLVLLGLDRVAKDATLSLDEYAERRWKALEENNPEPAESSEQDSEPSETAEQDSELEQNE